jgi:hypothetical protein
VSNVMKEIRCTKCEWISCGEDTRYRSAFPCPECRAPIRVLAGGMNMNPQNSIIDELMSSSPIRCCTLRCSNCDNEIVLIGYRGIPDIINCPDCETPYQKRFVNGFKA